MFDWFDRTYGPASRPPSCRAEDVLALFGSALSPSSAANLRTLHALAHELGLLCWGDVADRHLATPEFGGMVLKTRYEADAARRLANEPASAKEQLVVLHQYIWPRYLCELAPVVEKKFTALGTKRARLQADLANRNQRTTTAAQELAGVKAEIAALKLAFLRHRLDWNPLWETHT